MFGRVLNTSLGLIVSPSLKFQFSRSNSTYHCVKSIRIRSYLAPNFPAFGLNTERYAPYSDQNNSEYRHFLRSVRLIPFISGWKNYSKIFLMNSESHLVWVKSHIPPHFHRCASTLREFSEFALKIKDTLRKNNVLFPFKSPTSFKQLSSK